ncbi:hypothetical protein Bca101_056418 [Brassica carinata]
MVEEEEAILGFLKNNDEISNSGDFPLEHDLDHEEVKNFIKSLQDFGYIEAKEGTISIDDLKRMLDPWVFHVGSKQTPKKKWVAILGKQVSRTVQHVEDKVKEMLLQIQQGVEELDKESLKSLKTRKLVELEFKEYNFNAKGQPILDAGHLHPLLKVQKQFKDIFCQMGFEEMPTNNFVESSFWNFDALFQPQQHPAPDSHDTFFLKSPPTTREIPEDYLERTVRVFRNEAVDRTHLAEFHQIEGLVCDRGLTWGDLIIGVLQEFFSRLGMSKLRFKPAYKPVH